MVRPSKKLVYTPNPTYVVRPKVLMYKLIVGPSYLGASEFGKSWKRLGIHLYCKYKIIFFKAIEVLVHAILS